MSANDESNETTVRTPLDVLKDSRLTHSVRQHVPIIGRDDAERELGLPTERLLKTMVFRAGDTMVLAALQVHGRVSYGKLARAIGVSRSTLRPADAEDLRSVGMVPGGASPVCGVDGVVTVFDVAVPDMGLVRQPHLLI
jgi:Cys-tRNA(Pro)/Cys-tRNA(Cys) deacylase